MKLHLLRELQRIRDSFCQDSDDDFRLGYSDFSKRQKQQSFSGLHSARQTARQRRLMGSNYFLTD